MTKLSGPVLNSGEAAAYCGFRGGGQSMRNLKHRGVGPEPHRVGRSLVYYPAQLDEWIANGGSAGTAQKRNAPSAIGANQNKTGNGTNV